MTGQPVVVGVDGSASSAAACAVDAAEAGMRRLPLTLVHAWEAPYPVFADVGWMPLPLLPESSELEAVARQTLTRTADPVTRQPLPRPGDLVTRTAPQVAVDVRLVQSDPTEALLDASRRASLLVVGGV